MRKWGIAKEDRLAIPSALGIPAEMEKDFRHARERARNGEKWKRKNMIW